VLTYYRRHPQRARTRLLDLLGEVLTPTAPAVTPSVTPSVAPRPAALGRPPAPPVADDPRSLWLRTQGGVAPRKRKK
jgi:hypothetical protein